jgi:hypothetical protein
MEQNPQVDRKESTGVALSGMIFGIVGFICAFIPDWRTFGLVLGFFSLAISVFALYRTSHAHAKRVRAVVGCVAGVLAIVVAALFIYMRTPDKEPDAGIDAIPQELTDTTGRAHEEGNALEKLQGITDSAEKH